MPEKVLGKKFDFDLTSKSAFSKDTDVFTSRSFAAFLAKNFVPYYQKKLADSYVIIKKVFGFQVCMSRISKTEQALLTKYKCKTLEFTTMEEMYKELAFLQQMATDERFEKDAEALFEIRVKELRFINASRYATVSDEIYNGYLALEHYLSEISRHIGK